MSEDVDLSLFNTTPGGVGEYVGVVRSSYFDSSEEYDNLQLVWELEILEPEDFGYDTRNVYFSLGKKFETLDSGATAVSEKGKPEPVPENTRMGYLIQRAFYDPDSNDDPPVVLSKNGDGEEIEPFMLREHFINQGKHPLVADAWEGLKFRFHQEEVDYGPSIKARPFDMPFEFLGSEDGEADEPEPEPEPKPKAKKSSGRKRAAKKAKPEVDWTAVKDILLDEGAEAEEFGEFVDVTLKYLEDNDLLDSDGVEDVIKWLQDEEGAWAEYEEE